MTELSERDRQLVQRIAEAVGWNRFKEFLIHYEAGALDLTSDELPEEMQDMLNELRQHVPEDELEPFLDRVSLDADALEP